MKSILRYALTLAAFAGICSTGFADHHKKPVDLEGKWNVTASSDQGEREITWNIKKEKDKLTGTSKDGESGDERKLDRIRIEEKKVTIEIDVEQDGNTGIIKVVAEEKEAGKLTGKWSILSSDGTEFMSGELVAKKEVMIAFAGDWDATSKRPNGEDMKALMKLAGENDKLKGGFSSDRGEVAFSKVEAKDKSLRLELSFEAQDNTVPIVIEADLKEENKLVGRWVIKGEDGSEAATGDWSAIRKVAQTLAGAWDVTAALPEGNEVHGVLTLKKDGDNYTGTSKINDDEERKLTSVAVDDKKLVFTIDFERDGQSGTITVTAEQNDGKLKGKWSMAGSDGAEVAGDSWAASRQSESKEKRGEIKGREG